MVAIAKERPAQASSVVPSLPAGVDAFFSKALRKDAQDRFQTATEMIDAFLALAPAAPSEVVPPPPPPAPHVLTKIEASAPSSAGPGERDADGPAWKPFVHRGLVAGVILLCAGSYAYANRDAIRAAVGSSSAELPAPAAVQPQMVPGMLPRVELHGPAGPTKLPLDRLFIMNIWLQNCPDCMPSFEAWGKLALRSGIPDVPVVNVAYRSADPKWAESWAVRDGLVIDPGHLLVSPLGVSQFTTFVVAANGTILFRGNPTANSFESHLLAAVERGSSRP